VPTGELDLQFGLAKPRRQITPPAEVEGRLTAASARA
jgi:hypothetical protein